MATPDISCDVLTAQIHQLQTTLDLVGAYVYTKDLQGRYTFASKRRVNPRPEDGALFGTP